MADITPITKLLIANRGEIAVRIMRSAKSMGIKTVAVFSDADQAALHVKMADEAVYIGESNPARSYLNIANILMAARQTGADAVHPGYGFLAENPEFAEACEQDGITFVGPSPKAIRDMGDKSRAKALMEQAGVPCVPGYQGDDQSPDALLHQAGEIGFPIMIKAVAGGGGRGMRLVKDPSEFFGQLERAKSEAAAAFGDDKVLLERAITAPRHIEIQVLADRHGNVIHCAERDCSIQRRHQKVIEEAPSPAISAQQRAQMGAVSVAAAQAIAYEGAGTFEYLLDGDGQFYFMEMNTRLQVEHAVTEAVTGLDLVELQLRIAAGEPLPLSQDDVTISGHAIEVRLCAEDPEADFTPQSGTVKHWAPTHNVRVDHGLESGAIVSPHYDSMIAKVIAHAPTRVDASKKLIAALADTSVLGVRSNQGFLAKCLNHPVFLEGAATTGFIDEHLASLLPDRPEGEAVAAMTVAALLRYGPANPLVHGFPTPIRLARNNTVYESFVQVLPDGGCDVTMADRPQMRIHAEQVSPSEFALTLGEVRRSVVFVMTETGPVLQMNGQVFDFLDLTYQPEVDRTQAASDGKIRATMTGTVVAVEVNVGDAVAAGDKVVVLEAMKMEHVHTAPVSGVVSAVHVEVGAPTAAKALLVDIESDTDTKPERAAH